MRRGTSAAPRSRRPRPPRAEPLLSFVSLAVDDLGRATRFYRQALGLRPLDRTRALATFALGATRLALVRRPVLAAVAGLSDPRRGGSGVLLSRNVRRRGDVAALLARVRARGGRILRPAAAADWGGETGVFADPDGHRWEVAWNPRFSFAASGRRRGSPRPAGPSR
ncbi:MAG TPA: VOC family protein [Verrucomicrobiae bacterium]|nr:VOC family protein [Verrucomicrobiae bacterium]